MSIDQDMVKRVAKLARIAVSDDETSALATELSSIMGWIDQLDEVDTDGVEPVYSVMDIASAWREDAIADGGYPDKILANAPKTHDQHFVVPKVIE